jgi:hypothetical protein
MIIFRCGVFTLQPPEGTGFELRVLHLVGGFSASYATALALLALVIFQILSC